MLLILLLLLLLLLLLSFRIKLRFSMNNYIKLTDLKKHIHYSAETYFLSPTP